ncbi:hypothetical protein F4821DRAFT_279583 [Hypoxylon rubiginosum]|uniref:Uncharacterized protein n=1 Tax=Hypoxylon rubiginosum TaxID=110542 RepID=A0ACC0DHP7_9PEZI|nr:hypothetical protein F4821DRAFT_279583 [Hypoxylon rubiginosum]
MAKGLHPSQRDQLAPPDFIKAHKRTCSAPSSSGNNNPYLPSSYNQSMPRHIMDGSRKYPNDIIVDFNNGIARTHEQASEEEEIKCMFVPECDTGSQLRKAISHIFGRNKACTRMIPNVVWVHFCRKHYQRSRYRNAHEWAQIQCSLVGQQIARVQAWSDENQAAGQGPYLQAWTLTVRKREANRLQEKSQRQGEGSIDGVEDGKADSATLNGTAVPRWIRLLCGGGYSSARMTEIVNQLTEQVKTNALSQMPDIEILPDIVESPDDTFSKTAKSKSNEDISHRRSKSTPTTRRVTPPNTGLNGHRSPYPESQFFSHHDSPRSPPQNQQARHYDSQQVPFQNSQPTLHRDSQYQVPFRDNQPVSYHNGQQVHHRDNRQLSPRNIQRIPFRDRHPPSSRHPYSRHPDSRRPNSHHPNNQPTQYGDSQPVPYQNSQSIPFRDGPVQHWPTQQLPPIDRLQHLPQPDFRDDRRASHQRSLSAVNTYNSDFSFRSPVATGGFRTEYPVPYTEGQPAGMAAAGYDATHTTYSNPSYSSAQQGYTPPPPAVAHQQIPMTHPSEPLGHPPGPQGYTPPPSAVAHQQIPMTHPAES